MGIQAHTYIRLLLDHCSDSAGPVGITSDSLFRAINKAGRQWGNGFTTKLIWSVVKEAAADCGLAGLTPHERRRTCARPCYQEGCKLEHVQFLLGRVSIEATEKYLGCKQRFQNAVNGAIGLDPGGLIRLSFPPRS